MSKNITYFNNATDFKNKMTPVLSGEYSTIANNALLFSITEGILAGKYNTTGPLMILVEQNDNVDLVAVMTPPGRPIVISGGSKESINYLIDDLYSKNIGLYGVLGPVEQTDYFSSKWASLKGMSIELIMDEGVYLAQDIKFPSNVEGKLVEVSENDVNLVTDLCMKFIKEAVPNDPADVDDIRKGVIRGVEKNFYYLWLVNDRPVTLVGGGGFTGQFAKIAPVYTIWENRKNGYGAAAVATLSRQLLDRGYPFCCLFTDLSNKTSNSMYQSIGYKRVGTLKQNKFIEN